MQQFIFGRISKRGYLICHKDLQHYILWVWREHKWGTYSNIYTLLLNTSFCLMTRQAFHCHLTVTRNKQAVVVWSDKNMINISKSVEGWLKHQLTWSMKKGVSIHLSNFPYYQYLLLVISIPIYISIWQIL